MIRREQKCALCRRDGAGPIARAKQHCSECVRIVGHVGRERLGLAQAESVAKAVANR
jgi:hypothetical protein